MTDAPDDQSAPALARTDRFQRSTSQISTSFNTKHLILSLTANHYFSLDETGAYIWTLLEHPISLGDMANRILARYDIDQDTCRRDVYQVVSALLSEHLIERC